MTSHENDILNALEGFVKKESPSHNKELVDECGEYLQQLIKKHLDTAAEVIPQTEVGNHLQFTIGNGEEQILIVGHFDTDWDQGRLYYRIEGNKTYGPGIFDMKGGIIQYLWALKAIKDCGLAVNKKIVFYATRMKKSGQFIHGNILKRK